VASPKAPLLDATGKKSKDLTLEESVFAADVKAHVVHETVRAELNARRAGTRAAKSRGLVSGGRAKPWRQKGTGRARAGTIRAPQFTGGGVAFPPTPRDFILKVNRKARRSALAGALSAHATGGTLGVISTSAFEAPSTRAAAGFLSTLGQQAPTVIVATDEEVALWKSFRNLERVLICEPAELEVATILWARTLLVSETALPLVQARAQVKTKEASS
jgi:large subunit ribosomal protein L4